MSQLTFSYTQRTTVEMSLQPLLSSLYLRVCGCEKRGRRDTDRRDTDRNVSICVLFKYYLCLMCLVQKYIGTERRRKCESESESERARAFSGEGGWGVRERAIETVKRGGDCSTYKCVPFPQFNGFLRKHFVNKLRSLDFKSRRKITPMLMIRGMLHLVGIFLQYLWENIASQVEIIVSHRENIPFKWRNIGENLTSQALVTFDRGASARENVHTQVRAQKRERSIQKARTSVVRVYGYDI